MTFPVIASSASGVHTSTVSADIVVTMPASINAGDLLLVWIGDSNGALDVATPSGWTLIEKGTHSGVSKFFGSWYKIADGSEGASVTFVEDDVGGRATWVSARITGYSGTPIEAGGGIVEGTSTTPNPPSVDAGAAGDNLFFASCANANTVSDLSAPTDYTMLAQPRDTGGVNAQCGVASRELNAASDDPGTFSNSNNSPWLAHSIVIKPAVAGTAAKAYQYRKRRV